MTTVFVLYVNIILFEHNYFPRSSYFLVLLDVYVIIIFWGFKCQKHKQCNTQKQQNTKLCLLYWQNKYTILAAIYIFDHSMSFYSIKFQLFLQLFHFSKWQRSSKYWVNHAHNVYIVWTQVQYGEFDICQIDCVFLVLWNFQNG